MSDPLGLLTWTTFGAVAAMTLGGGVLTVALRNLFHAVLGLVVSLLGVAGVFLMLASEFVAVIHVLIYVGAIVTLFLFVIMLTHRIDSAEEPQTNRQWLAALILGAGLFAMAVSALLRAPWAVASPPVEAASVETLGREMLTTHVLAFEAVSLLLIVALVGAVTLARREETRP